MSGVTYRSLAAAVGLSLLIGGCGQSPPATPTEKISQPPPDQLSAQQLQDIVVKCRQYNNVEDSRVPYAASYCAAVEAARDTRTMPGGKDYKAPAVKPRAGVPQIQ